MEKEFARRADVARILKARNNHLIKVVTGLRKVGKSYLLSTLFQRELKKQGFNPGHIVEVDFNLDENQALLNKSNLRAYIDSRIKEDEKYILILDEIQEVDGFEKLLLSYNTKPNIDLYVTGNNSHNLSSDIDTLLSGSDDQIRLYPIGFDEFLENSSLDPESALTEYLKYGGMPLALKTDGDEEKERYLANLFATTYIKDIEQRHVIRNKPAFELLCDILSSDIGSLTNPTNIENTFKSHHYSLTNDTIANYISYLCDTFLFEECRRYDVKGKQYISTPVKYYCGDLGIRNARLSMREIEYQYLMENAIYLELKRRGCKVDVGVVPLEVVADGKRTYRYYEIDFVVNKGNRKVYIQVTMDLSSPGKLEQETKSLDNTHDHFDKIIVLREPGHKGEFNDKGYFIISLKDFLLDKSII